MFVVVNIFGHVPKLMFVAVVIFRSYSNRNLVTFIGFIQSFELASLNKYADLDYSKAR